MGEGEALPRNAGDVAGAEYKGEIRADDSFKLRRMGLATESDEVMSLKKPSISLRTGFPASQR